MRLARQATRKGIEKNLGACLNRAIRSCGTNPTLIFSGCPEVAQLAARVVDRLGLAFSIVRGTALAANNERVHHFWIELPDWGLRIETNPSQILGYPIFAMVLDLEEHADRYQGESDYPELLERVTPAGEAFYAKLADQVAKCVGSGLRKR